MKRVIIILSISFTMCYQNTIAQFNYDEFNVTGFYIFNEGNGATLQKEETWEVVP
jgi:hypothetical protein